jgi:hypothetical protein
LRRPLLVTTGLDPVVHVETQRTICRQKMSERLVSVDCRIKSGNDEWKNGEPSVKAKDAPLTPNASPRPAA